MTTALPYVVQFLSDNPRVLKRMPFLTEAERDSYLVSWAGVRDNLGEPPPAEGVDYLLEGPEQ